MTGKRILWTLAASVLFVGMVGFVVAQPGGGPGGGRGGFGFGGPVMGKVVDGNVQQGWISVQLTFGGRDGGEPPRTQVTLNQQSKLLKAETATLADLKVGDGLYVQGVPTALTGSQFIMGANTDATAQTMGLLSGGGFRMGRGGGQATTIPQTTGQTAGLVESLEPLRVKVSDTVTVEVTAADDARFTKLTEVPWESLEADANVLCTGQRNEDGSMTATVVTIVPEMPQMGMGGPGGGMGGPGGGMGGPGGGMGGPGGGRGGAGGGGGAGF